MLQLIERVMKVVVGPRENLSKLVGLDCWADLWVFVVCDEDPAHLFHLRKVRVHRSAAVQLFHIPRGSLDSAADPAAQQSLQPCRPLFVSEGECGMEYVVVINEYMSSASVQQM